MTQTQASIIAMFHNPNAIAETKGGHHIFEVWEDGELTMTKGGELYRQRNLHCLDMPLPDFTPWPLFLFPSWDGFAKHAAIQCTNEKTALEFRAAMRDFGKPT